MTTRYYVLEYRDKQILRGFLLHLKKDDPVHNKLLAILVGVDFARYMSVCAEHRPQLVRYKVAKCNGRNTVKEMYKEIGEGEPVNDFKSTSCGLNSVKEFFDYIGFNHETYEFNPDSVAMRNCTTH